MFKNNKSPKMVLALRIHILYFLMTSACLYFSYTRMGAEYGLRFNIIVGCAMFTVAILLSLFVLKSVNNQFEGIISDLTTTSDDMHGASTSLADSSRKLAEGSAEQSSSVHETSATMEETSSLVQQTTQNTREALALAENAKGEAGEGVDAVSKLLSSMSQLEKSSEEVQRIIKVIDDMAFQTNILSLNAAVEAARAGDAGKGFAVVAEEVRNLAQRSAQAARETAVLIDGNVNLTNEAVNVSGKVGDQLKRIDTSVSKVKELLDEISTASQEQVIAAGQIAQAITQIDQVVQSQSHVAQTTAAGADQLEDYCKELKNVAVELIGIIKDPGSYMHSNTAAQLGAKGYSSPKLASGPSERRDAPLASKAKQKLPGAVAVNPEDVIPLDDF